MITNTAKGIRSRNKGKGLDTQATEGPTTRASGVTDSVLRLRAVIS